MDLEKFEQAKTEMKNYTDFYGGELLDKNDIDDAKNIFDLENIINRHHDYITDMATDAQSSLDRFKRSLGLF